MGKSLTHQLPRILFVLFGTTLGAVLLVFLLRSVKLDQLGGALSNADYALLTLAFVPLAINILIKVPRAALLYGTDAPDWDTLFGAINVGYGLNTLLPARLGEVGRAYWIRDRAGIAMVRSLSIIALERVTDGVTLIILLLALAPTVAFPGTLLGPALTIGAIFVAVLVSMVVLASTALREGGRLHSSIRRLEVGRWAVAGQAVRQIVNGLQVLSSRKAILLLLTYTAIVWASNSVFAWIVLRAFHIDVAITAGILLIAVLNLGMSVPSSPGYVGVFDYLTVLMLGLYQVGRTPALAAALVLHVLSFGPPTLIGIVYAARSGLQTTWQMFRTSEEKSG